MGDEVGQLVELAEAPLGERGPAARARGGGVVVERLRMAQEEVDQQEGDQEGRQQQVRQRHAPAQQT